MVTAYWANNQSRETGPEQIGTGEPSTAATVNAAVHDAEEYLDSLGDPDHVDTAPMFGSISKPIANGPADSTDVSV